MSSENNLFPIFLKINELKTLIVGGGNVALEKLNALLKNDSEAKIVLIGRSISKEIKAKVAHKPTVELKERSFEAEDLNNGIQLIILATDKRAVNKIIYDQAKKKGILTNVADTPDLCDFYLGSTVTKGNLKIGISTNGQSPTFAKRFRQVLEDVLPDETSELLNNLNRIRNSLKGSFAEKVKVLNERTKDLVSGK